MNGLPANRFVLIYIHFHERDFQLRTRATHQTHCSSLGGPLHDHIATTYGLNRESSLNKLAHFHTTEGLIPDVMHDIFEGVLPLAIKYILKHLLALTSLTVVEMNRRIETFDYGVIEASNRPRGNLTTSQLNGGDSLKQSGEYCTLNKHKIGDSCNSNKDTDIHVIHTTLVQLLIEQ